MSGFASRLPRMLRFFLGTCATKTSLNWPAFTATRRTVTSTCDIQAYYSAVEHAGHAGDLPAWLEDRDWSPERAAAFVTATQYDRTKVCVL